MELLFQDAVFPAQTIQIMQEAVFLLFEICSTIGAKLALGIMDAAHPKHCNCEMGVLDKVSKLKEYSSTKGFTMGNSSFLVANFFLGLPSFLGGLDSFSSPFFFLLVEPNGLPRFFTTGFISQGFPLMVQ